ncbi:MAG: DUF6161 domain-containing protein [Parvibaculum sp.]
MNEKAQKPVFPLQVTQDNVTMIFKDWSAVDTFNKEQLENWARLLKPVFENAAVVKLFRIIQEGYERVEMALRKQTTDSVDYSESLEAIRSWASAIKTGRYPVPRSKLWGEIDALALSKNNSTGSTKDLERIIFHWIEKIPDSPKPTIAATGAQETDILSQVEDEVRKMFEAERGNVTDIVEAIDRKKNAILAEIEQAYGTASGDFKHQELKTAAALTDLKRNFSKELEDQIKAVTHDYSTTMQSTIDAAAKAASETVLTSRELELPAKYWNDKSSAHNKGSFWYAFLFVVGTGAAILGLIFLAHNRLVELGIEKIDPWQLVFLEIVAPGLLFIWLLRTAAKMLTRELNMRDDAKERVTMMNAYLALTVRGKVTEEDKHLMIRALFRPAQAEIADEPMPGWLGTIMDRAGGKTGGT